MADDALQEKWCAQACEFLDKLAEDFGVQLFVENTLDMFPDILCRLMEKVNRENVHVCLDVGHSHLSKAPLEAWFAALQPNIQYMHINDNFGIYDEHLAVGEGTIDWKLCKTLLKRYHLDPIITIEVAGCEEIRKSLCYWESI